MRQRADTAVVTGLHRSGTTFVATVLASAQNTVEFPKEPLNPKWGLNRASTWYPELPGPAMESPVMSDLRRVLRGDSVTWTTPGRRLPRARAMAFTYQHGALVRHAVRKGRTVVIKDPFLSLSLEFAATELTSRTIVVVVKHPVAWCMSICRMGWHPGTVLNELLSRETFAADASALGVPGRDWSTSPILETSSWTWSLLMSRVYAQLDALPAGSAVLVPLERFGTDPLATAFSLVEAVGLARAPDTEKRIRDLTEATTVVPQNGQAHVLARDSRASTEAWRTAMPESEQRLIWDICGNVAGRDYSL